MRGIYAGIDDSYEGGAGDPVAFHEAPGFIKTPMAKKVDGMMDESYDERLNALHPMGLGNPEDIANAILFLFSDMSKWMTGAVMNVDGGFTAQ